MNDKNGTTPATASRQEMPDDQSFDSRQRRLEGIFNPLVHRQREILFPSDQAKPARFIHYTSAEAAVHIMREKRLWLRSTACMNDYREVQHGFEILHKYFVDKDKNLSFIRVVDSVAPGAASEALSHFNNLYSSGFCQFQTFIASLSEHREDEDHHGRLSMWRAFGKTSSRVGLVLNVPQTSKGARAMRLLFSPVCYCDDNHADQMMSEVIRNITANDAFLRSVDRTEIINWIYTMLLVNVTCVKHKGFKEEREWRVVYSPTIYNSSLIESCTQIIDGTPQTVYILPLDKKVDPVLEDMDISVLIDRVIIGPSMYPITMLDAFDQVMTKAGVERARSKIVISNIPIRV